MLYARVSMPFDSCAPPLPMSRSKTEKERERNASFYIYKLLINSWLGQLEKTMWLQHMSGLLGATMTVVHTIEKNGRPVLVHCSDGWDRTPQIVASAQLCLDPYYRTVEVSYTKNTQVSFFKLIIFVCF